MLLLRGFASSITVLGLLSAAAASSVHQWKSVSVEDFGAVGDNVTDNTKAFRSALLAVAGGGEIVVPGGGSKVFRTAPVNLTSNVVLRVDGTMRAVEDKTKFPVVRVFCKFCVIICQLWFTCEQTDH
jgi:polygalacturonase